MKLSRRHGLTWTAAALVGVAAGPFAASAQVRVGHTYDEIQERGRIRIAFYKDFAPWSFRADGRWQGIDVDIANLIGEELGVTTNYMPIGADENVDDDLRNAVWKGHYLGGGVANVMLHVPVAKELDIRNDLVVIFGPYHVENLAFAVDPERIPEDATPAIFQFEPVGVELDSLPDFYLSRAFAGRLAGNVRRFLPVEQAIDALKAGEVAAVMAPQAQLEFGLRDDAKFRLQDLPTPGLHMPTWPIGASVRHNYRQLAYAVGDILTAAIRDGRIPAIFASYGVTYTRPPYI